VDTADRVTRADLTDGKSTAEAQDVETVLEAFTAERLLTLTAATVELSHEVLLTAWPLLRDTWLADTHADRMIRTRLRNTAADWERHARDPSYLYGGSLLAAATDTAARGRGAYLSVYWNTHSRSPRLAGIHHAVFPIVPVGNQIADSVRLSPVMTSGMSAPRSAASTRS
jgi:hypothetical protein